MQSAERRILGQDHSDGDEEKELDHGTELEARERAETLGQIEVEESESQADVSQDVGTKNRQIRWRHRSLGSRQARQMRRS